MTEIWLEEVPLRQLNCATMDMDPRYDGASIYLSRVSDLDPKMAQATYPNRHTFYEILWATGGQGVHYIDFTGYAVKTNTLFFVTPGQIHFWDLTIPLEGIFIMFQPDFFHLHHPDPNFMYQFDYFNRTDCPPLLKVDDNRADFYNLLIDQLVDEFSQPRPGQDTILSGFLQVLLMQVQRDYVGTSNESSRSYPAVIANQFQKLVSEHFNTLQSVHEYASLLHVSTSYLSRTIKQHTGLAAGDLIRQRIVLAAKRMLCHTTYTVAEIAYELNFRDASYFTRFFRRETGMNPMYFRRNFRANIPH